MVLQNLHWLQPCFLQPLITTLHTKQRGNAGICVEKSVVMKLFVTVFAVALCVCVRACAYA